MRSLSLPARCLALFLGLALAAGCGDSFGLGRATLTNEVDTLALYAIDGTPLDRPSAYDVTRGIVVRTDRSTQFDVAFNVHDTQGPVLLPTGALGLGRGSGILVSTQPFDSIKVAPNVVYLDSLPVPVAVDAVVVLRSRPVTCFGTTFFLYAKLRVLTYDAAERRLDFEVLANLNCGYRGLERGLPTR